MGDGQGDAESALATTVYLFIFLSRKSSKRGPDNISGNRLEVQIGDGLSVSAHFVLAAC